LQQHRQSNHHHSKSGANIIISFTVAISAHILCSLLLIILPSPDGTTQIHLVPIIRDGKIIIDTALIFLHLPLSVIIVIG
jgi:hypothetical protein